MGPKFVFGIRKVNNSRARVPVGKRNGYVGFDRVSIAARENGNTSTADAVQKAAKPIDSRCLIGDKGYLIRSGIEEEKVCKEDEPLSRVNLAKTCQRRRDERLIDVLHEQSNFQMVSRQM